MKTKANQFGNEFVYYDITIFIQEINIYIFNVIIFISIVIYFLQFLIILMEEKDYIYNKVNKIRCDYFTKY